MKVTSNASVVHQPVDPSKGLPCPPHRGRDRRLLRAHVEIDRDGSRIHRRGRSIDLPAEGFEEIDPPRGHDEPAAGPGKVEAEASPNA